MAVSGGKNAGKAETLFTQDKAVEVLLATDAAGEGINLQRAHLMVNYDLPWESEPPGAALWPYPPHRSDRGLSLLASRGLRDARGRGLYRRLLDKIEEERKALGGKVFDILGKLTFNDKPLRHLLLEGGSLRRPAGGVRARLDQVVDHAMDHDAPACPYRRTRPRPRFHGCHTRPGDSGDDGASRGSTPATAFRCGILYRGAPTSRGERYGSESPNATKSRMFLPLSETGTALSAGATPYSPAMSA